MTKSEVHALIDRLADKTISFGCEVRIKEPPNPYLLGDTVTQTDAGCSRGTVCTHLVCAGCVGDFESSGYEVIGHPIMLGDVLARGEINVCWEEEERDENRKKLIDIWYECGISKSLQQIVEASGFERVCKECMSVATKNCDKPDHNYQGFFDRLKPAEARALFSYLAEIFSNNPTK